MVPRELSVPHDHIVRCPIGSIHVVPNCKTGDVRPGVIPFNRVTLQWCGDLVLGAANTSTVHRKHAYELSEQIKGSMNSPNEPRTPELPTAAEDQRTEVKLRNHRLLPLITIANVLYLLLLGAITFSNMVGPERWWGGSLNLYLPQVAWGLPLVALLPATVLFARRRLWMCAAGAVWLAWPIMGLCLHLPMWLRAGSSGGIPIRVMTYNIKFGWRDADAIRRDVESTHPDILLMQDVGGFLPAFLTRSLSAYHVVLSGQYIIASKFPIVSSEDRSISFNNAAHHHYVRCKVMIDGKPVTVCCVHLLTPRAGLSAVRHSIRGSIDDGIDVLEANTSDRMVQAGKLSADVQSCTGPIILTGDLNATPASLVIRDLQRVGLKDAFSEAGWGYGYSYGQTQRFHRAFLRIDHIMTSSDFYATRAWVGNSTGSDHCPVIADLVMSKR